MSQKITFLLLCTSLFFIACKNDAKKSDIEKIEQSAKYYFFLNDSVDVSVKIMDTLFTDDLDTLQKAVAKNRSLVNLDLDTLSIMIDDANYKLLSYKENLEKTILFKKEKYRDSIQKMKTKILGFQIMQANLKSQRDAFFQTDRILLHLQRSIWANIAGYNIEVNYNYKDQVYDLELLMDANFVVVD